MVETFPRMSTGGAPRGLYGLSLRITDSISKRRSGVMVLVKVDEGVRKCALYGLQERRNVLCDFNQRMMKRFAQSARKHQVKLVVQEFGQVRAHGGSQHTNALKHRLFRWCLLPSIW